MKRPGKLTDEQCSTVEGHLDYCITVACKGLKNAIDQCAIVEDNRTIGMRAYWQNVVSGLKWAKQQLTYRKESKSNAEPESVQ